MTIRTPLEVCCSGEVVATTNIVAVSIIRAGDSMLDTFMSVVPEASVGKVLIQRNEETLEPMLFYSKLPDLRGKDVVLLDPMLATGGSARCAIRVLLEKGASEDRIFFFNVLACPAGIAAMTSYHPGKRSSNALHHDFFNI